MQTIRILLTILICGALLWEGKLEVAIAETSDQIITTESVKPLAPPDATRAVSPLHFVSAIGNDVIKKGGNAADAAVAMYFVLSVILPSRASLGGSGQCLVLEESQPVFAYEFGPTRPHTNALGGGAHLRAFLQKTQLTETQRKAFLDRSLWQATLPANLRGLWALHQDFGRLSWQTLLNPAVLIAQSGTPVNDLFLKDMTEALKIFTPFSSWESQFLRAGSVLPTARSLWTNRPLSRILWAASRNSPKIFYQGEEGRIFVEEAALHHSQITMDNMTQMIVHKHKALAIPIDLDRIIWIPTTQARQSLAIGRAIDLINRLFEETPPRRIPDLQEAMPLLLKAYQLSLRRVDKLVYEDGQPKVKTIDLQTLRKAQKEEEEEIKAVLNNLKSLSPLTAPYLKAVRMEPHNTTFSVWDHDQNLVNCSFSEGGLMGTGDLSRGIVLGAAVDPDRFSRKDDPHNSYGNAAQIIVSNRGYPSLSLGSLNGTQGAFLSFALLYQHIFQPQKLLVEPISLFLWPDMETGLLQATRTGLNPAEDEDMLSILQNCQIQIDQCWRENYYAKETSVSTFTMPSKR